VHLLVRDAERAGGHLDDLWVLVGVDLMWLVGMTLRETDISRPSVVCWCIFFFPQIHLGVQPLPHLGAPVGDQHGAVLVHVHERAALLCFVLGGWDGTGWVRKRGKEECFGSSFCVCVWLGRWMDGSGQVAQH
jgi:hypothetical protein